MMYPMKEVLSVKHYRHPILFYSLATILPWICWFSAGYISHIVPIARTYIYLYSGLEFLGLLMPALIAFIFIIKDEILLKDVINRSSNFKEIKPRYIILTCCIMPASILLAQTISLLFGYSASQFQITGEFSFSAGIFPVWFVLIIAPLIEELAWHTYGTDCLVNRFNLLKSSLLFALFWGIWHLPLSTIKDYYQSNVAEMSVIYSINFLLSIIPFVIIMNWLYYRTGRSIIVAIIFHITSGFFNEIFSTHPDSKIIQTILLIVLAVLIVIKDKGLFFNKTHIIK